MARHPYHEIDGRGPPIVSRAWYIVKIVFRVLSIIICCASIGLILPVALKYKEEANRFEFNDNLALDVGITVGPVVVVIIWDIIEFITLCVRRGHGIHPGFHVAVELIFWLTVVLVSAAVARVAWIADENLQEIKDALNSDKLSDIVSSTDLTIFTAFAMKTKVTAGLFGLLALLRFILFVRACIETDRRRKAKRRTPIIVTSHHGPDREAAIPLTAYDPVTPIPGTPPQYHDYTKPAAH